MLSLTQFLRCHCSGLKKNMHHTFNGELQDTSLWVGNDLIWKFLFIFAKVRPPVVEVHRTKDEGCRLSFCSFLQFERTVELFKVKDAAKVLRRNQRAGDFNSVSPVHLQCRADGNLGFLQSS